MRVTPQGNTVHPPNSIAANLLGPGGAWLARTLLETLGIAVYFLLASWLVLVVLLLLRRGLLTWSLRAAGWLLLIPCAAVSADYLDRDFSAGAVSGSGGTLGAWLHGWLDATFYSAGCYAILGSCLCLALVLALDFILAPLLGLLGKTVRWLVGRLAASGQWLASGPGRPQIQANCIIALRLGTRSLPLLYRGRSFPYNPLRNGPDRHG